MKNKEKIDLSGLKCPEDLLLIRKRLRELEKGSSLEVKTKQDIEKKLKRVCSFLPYKLVKSIKNNNIFLFTIKS